MYKYSTRIVTWSEFLFSRQKLLDVAFNQGETDKGNLPPLQKPPVQFPRGCVPTIVYESRAKEQERPGHNVIYVCSGNYFALKNPQFRVTCVSAVSIRVQRKQVLF